jgi:transcriptional regulator with XRE-family HTH domain
METFSERLRGLRKKYEISQDKLAKELGTTKATISRYENGLREPKAEFVQQLAGYFHVSVDYLLGETDVPEKSKLTPNDRITQIVADDPDLAEEWKELRGREDLFLLFKEVRDLDPRTIKQIIQIIKVIDSEEN